MREYGFNTTLLHGSEDKNPFGATQVPIYQSSAFRHDSAEELEKIFANKTVGYSYTRINNPTIESFERRMTKLEGGIGSVATSSGMSALHNALMNILRNGDHIVAAAGLYGGTVELLEELQAYGIRTTYVKENSPEAFQEAILPETRAVFAETISNPKLDVTDIRGVAEVAHKNGIPFLIDKTVATPYLVNPLKLGADVVIHSSSKYINGSSDAISGILISGGSFKWDKEKYPGMVPFLKYGSFAYLAKLRNGLFRSTGSCLAPQNAFLNNLGLETLGLRMRCHCSNAMELAEFLKELGHGITVSYPGLKDHPYHKIAAEQFHGGFGAIITLRTGSKERAFRILNELKIPWMVSNIGDTKTLVIHPSSTIAAHLSEEEKNLSGVYDDMIRISVGIEDIEDLKQDFKRVIEGE